MSPDRHYNSIRDQLKRWRYKNRVSLRAAAKSSGVDFTVLYRFESGGEIMARTFLRLVAFLERNGKAK